MLTAMHLLVYSDDPTATRAYFKDVLRWPFISEGADGDHGVGNAGTADTDPAEWLIFGTGPSELGVHPTSEVSEGKTWSAPRQHQILLMCDDVEATIAELTERGARFTGEVEDMGFGLVILLKVPGADDIMLYEPKHPKAYLLA